MLSTISSLYHLQKGYLFNLLDNITDDILYEKQLEGFNSPSWILGHICIEGEDVLNHFNIPFTPTNWKPLFQMGTGKITSLEGLPSKKELIDTFIERYTLLINKYKSLSETERALPHPSAFMKSLVPDIDSWFAHHLITHIAIHCGNIVVWKKMMVIEIGGY